MNKIFGVLLSFFTFFAFPAPANAMCEGSSYGKCVGKTNLTCRKIEEQVRKCRANEGRSQVAPVYKEVLGYAKNPAIKPSTQGSCSADGRFMGVTNENSWCKDYKDRDGEKWRAVFETRQIYRNNLRMIIRLADNASVTFDLLSGDVLSDNIKPRSASATQTAQPENYEPAQSAEDQVQQQVRQIDPATVAKKAMGAIFKGF